METSQNSIFDNAEDSTQESSASEKCSGALESCGSEMDVKKNGGKLVDASSQTDFVVVDVDLPQLKKRMAAEVLTPLTAESIAATAQSVMNQSGWVYDHSTKTYFDYNTNLYYYPHTRLYYNYKNGTYYRYNQETQKYEFHYQLEAFKGSEQLQNCSKPNVADWKQRIVKLKFGNLKRLKYTYCGDNSPRNLNKSSDTKTDRSTEISAESREVSCFSYLERRQDFMGVGLSTLLQKRNLFLNGHVSDSEHDFVRKTLRKQSLCQKCSRLTTAFCCQVERFSSDTQSSVTEKAYCSDSELETISVNHMKYVQCGKCQRLAHSACCVRVEFWLGKAMKRKRSGRRRRSKRRRSVQDNASHLADKERESNSSSDSSDTLPPVDFEEPVLEVALIPCVRAMVTSSQSLKVGTLFLITCGGATFGSGDQCDIHIEEDGIDEKHASISYFKEQSNYFVTDLGSKTGTTLNSTCEHNPGTTAVLATPVNHKSILLIGSCIFVLHLHLGYETCDDCEPGQIQAMLGQDQPVKVVQTLTKREKEIKRRSELKSIKKKYDLHKEQYIQKKTLLGSCYTDRAAGRRHDIGSDNPYEKDEMPTSYETELADHNKGHQMLKKMGWTKGKSLGKSQEGITEPIVPRGTGKGKLGLGFGAGNAKR